MSDRDVPLRDYLAAQALHGLMLRYQEPGYRDFEAAVEAYKIADYMMEIRNRKVTQLGDIELEIAKAGYVEEAESDE